MPHIIQIGQNAAFLLPVCIFNPMCSDMSFATQRFTRKTLSWLQNKPQSLYEAFVAAAGSAAQRLSSRLEGEGPGAPAATPGRNGSKGGFSLDPGNRTKIRDKLLASTQKSAALSQMPRAELDEHVRQMEAACHDSSSSRCVAAYRV